MGVMLVIMLGEQKAIAPVERSCGTLLPCCIKMGSGIAGMTDQDWFRPSLAAITVWRGTVVPYRGWKPHLRPREVAPFADPPWTSCIVRPR